MKTIRIIVLALVTSLIPIGGFCQESLEPAPEETPELVSEADADADPAEAVSSEEAPSPEADVSSSEEQESVSQEAAEEANVPKEAPSAESQERKTATIGEQLVTFFEGLDAAVSTETDCSRISAAITVYCEKHSSWISSLDYATGNVDDETTAQIHAMALEFGKKLSSCYEEASIPTLLRRYAGMGPLD